MTQGLYIVFEGMSGCGKTTQSKQLQTYLLNNYPQSPSITTYEPGGSEIANAIRVLVQGTKFTETMDPLCEAHLYAASRAQTIATITRPHLEKRGIVISDRSFVTSMAYQGYARNLGFEKIIQVNRLTFEQAFPDIIFYLDLDPQEGLSRMFNHAGDKFENEKLEFYQKVREGYFATSKLQLFQGHWQTINADNKSVAEIHQEITQSLQPYLQKLKL